MLMYVVHALRKLSTQTCESVEYVMYDITEDILRAAGGALACPVAVPLRRQGHCWEKLIRVRKPAQNLCLFLIGPHEVTNPFLNHFH